MILSLLLISIFAINVHAEEKGIDAIKKAVDKFLGLFENTLGAVFARIIKNPDAWLRVMLFIGVFAMLYAIGSTDESIRLLGSHKTAGILAFVIAFATAALPSQQFLLNIAYLYGGLILTVIIAIPIAILLGITYYIWQAKSLAIYFILWILWFTELMILSEFGLIRSSLQSLGLTFSGSIDMIMGIFILICLFCVFLLSYGILCLLGVFGKASQQTEIRRLKEMPEYASKIKNFFGLRKGRPAMISVFYDRAEEASDYLDIANKDAKDKTKDSCEQSLKNAINSLINLQEKGLPNIKDAVDKLSSAKIVTPTIEDEMAYIDANANDSIQYANEARTKIKKTTGTNWKQVKAEITKATSSLRAIQKIITEIMALQSKRT